MLKEGCFRIKLMLFCDYNCEKLRKYLIYNSNSVKIKMYVGELYEIYR